MNHRFRNLAANRLISFFELFFLAPASARPLAILRVLLSVVLIMQALFLSSQLMDLLGPMGIIQGPLSQYLNDPNLPTLSSVNRILSHFGIVESQTIFLTAGLYFLSLLLLLAGYQTRAASVSTWLFHWILFNTGHCAKYGVDTFAHIALFYLIFMPVGKTLSLDAFFSQKPDAPSAMARLSLRVLQVHLCIAYLASGIEKASGPQWWNGDAIWRALMLPIYSQFDMSWLASYSFLAKLGCWTTLVVEIGYAIFIWPRKTRKLWIFLTLGLHLGIALFLGLEIFSLVMCVLTFSAFGVSAKENSCFQKASSPPPTSNLPKSASISLVNSGLASDTLL